MPRWFRKLLWGIYGIENRKVHDCTLVVPLGYGLDVRGFLPLASRETLVRGAALARDNSVPIAFASASYFGRDSQMIESAQKKTLLLQLGFQSADEIIAAADGVTNTIGEARALHEHLKEYPTGLINCIVIVSDWAHARRARYVFKKVFPQSVIVVHSVVCPWGALNRAWYQKFEFVWFLANIVQDCITRILGIERAAKLQHPLSSAG